MKQTLISLIIVSMTVIACSTGSRQTDKDIIAYNEELTADGDSSCYGLACDGSTDSLLVYLPFKGSDPDTVDILSARVNHRVFGRPDIGDEVAVILNDSNKAIAELVINIDWMKGKWCYMAYPHMRRRTGAAADSIVRLPKDFPDSLREKWFQPLEYGIELLNDHVVRPIGMRDGNTRQNGPMEYPEMKRYRQWHFFNGHLLLSETKRDSAGNQQVASTDTADIVLLRRDTLILRFADHEQNYYRKN